MIKKSADLNILPQPRSEEILSEYTLGDLHGNAIKLIYTLVEIGLLKKFSNFYYKTLVDIYYTNLASLDSGEVESRLELFEFIVNQMCFSSLKTKLRLIGDELSDRGSCDWFTLLIIARLSQAGVDFEILISNHSMEFLYNFEKKESFAKSYFLNMPEHYQSAVALQQLINRGHIKRARVEHIIEENYLPNLKLVSYTEDSDRVAIYTHAPVGLDIISTLINSVLKRKPGTGEILSLQDIDLLNETFQKEYVKKGAIHLLFDHSSFQDLVWNRGEVRGAFPVVTLSGKKLSCRVHGHDSTQMETNDEHVNLDNGFGKHKKTSGVYTLLGYCHLPLQKLGEEITNLPKKPEAPVALSKPDSLYSASDKASDCWLASLERPQSFMAGPIRRFEELEEFEEPEESKESPQQIMIAYFTGRLDRRDDAQNFLFEAIHQSKTLENFVGNFDIFEDVHKSILNRLFLEYKQSPHYKSSNWDEILTGLCLVEEGEISPSWLLNELKTYCSKSKTKLMLAMLNDLEDIKDDAMLMEAIEANLLFNQEKLTELQKIPVEGQSAAKKELISEFHERLVKRNSLFSANSVLFFAKESKPANSSSSAKQEEITGKKASTLREALMLGLNKDLSPTLWSKLEKIAADDINTILLSENCPFNLNELKILKEINLFEHLSQDRDLILSFCEIIDNKLLAEEQNDLDDLLYDDSFDEDNDQFIASDDDESLEEEAKPMAI